jgi:hypothetical protein
MAWTDFENRQSLCGRMVKALNLLFNRSALFGLTVVRAF